jgi:acyl-CoA dehydrogenase
MISFALTKRDEEILEEARAQARLAAKYARDFERDEDRLLPHAYPEAEGRPDTRELMRRQVRETSGEKILNALLYLEDWRGGVPLRESRYSLGNTVLKIAGTPQQYARWADRTIAIGLTEPIGGSDPASIRTTAAWDAATNEWVIEGEKTFITYAESCDAVLVLARIVHPERRGLSTFIVEKGAPGFHGRAPTPQDGHTFRGHRRAGVRQLSRVRLQSHRRRPEEDAAIIQRVPPRRRRLRARRHPRGYGLHMGAPRGDRDHA